MQQLSLIVCHSPPADPSRSVRMLSCVGPAWLIVLCIMAIGFAAPARASSSVTLTGRNARVQLKRAEMQLFCDPAHQHTIQSVQEQQFEVPASDIPTFGYTNASYWVRLRLTNTDPTRWWLHYNWIFADTIEFYVPTGSGDWKMTRTGFALPFQTRPLPISTFAFPLDFAAHPEQEVYLRVSSSAPLAIHLFAEPEELLREGAHQTDMAYAMYAGGLLVMLLYNFFIWLYLRKKRYLYYVLTIICTLAIFLSISGYTFRYGWPEQPLLNLYFSKVCMGLIIITTSLFATRFLQLSRFAPKFIRLFQVMMVLAVAGILHTITDFRSDLTNTLVGIQSAMLLAAGVTAWSAGNRSARFFVIAWALYIMGGLLITLANIGLVEYTLLARHLVVFGSFCEALLLALALADHYRRLGKEKELLQAQSLQAEQQMREQLEQIVAERTKDLADRNEQLAEANEELRSFNAKIEEQANSMKQITEDLQKSNETKDRLFAIIGHDLRGPVNSVLAMLKMLTSKMISQEEFLSFSGKMTTDVQIVHDTMNNLLTWAQSQRTNIQPNPVVFDLCGPAIENVALTDEIAAFKQISILQDIPEGIQVWADPEHIRLIFRNLLSNAVKFTKNGGTVRISACVTASGMVEVCVQDNGVGMTAEMIENLFTIGKTARGTNNEKGTGIGLTLCKDFCQQNGGSMRVESTTKVGSSFYFTLPLAAHHQPASGSSE